MNSSNGASVVIPKETFDIGSSRDSNFVSCREPADARDGQLTAIFDEAKARVNGQPVVGRRPMFGMLPV
jgi:hypothetical protein